MSTFILSAEYFTLIRRLTPVSWCCCLFRDVFASLVLSSEEATYPGGSECRGQPVADWLQVCPSGLAISELRLTLYHTVLPGPVWHCPDVVDFASVHPHHDTGCVLSCT